MASEPRTSAGSRLALLLIVAAMFVGCGGEIQNKMTHGWCPETDTTSMSGKLDCADQAFGSLVVGPLARLMFYDVAFWDNTVSGRDAVGVVSGDEVVVSLDDQGYGYARVVDADRADVTPALDAPRDIAFGPVQITVSPAADGTLTGQVQAKPTPDAALDALPSDPESAPVAVTGLAPFPVTWNPATQSFDETKLPFPANKFPLDVGDKVIADGASATIATLDGDTLTLRGETRYSDAPPANPENVKFPVVVLWLVLGAIFFTLRMAFVNLRGFKHAIEITAGKYDDPDDPGEITHFQALSSALSATVGLGNIAGVAIAISLGGPGAIFWMICAGFLGMSSKFTEVTLGQMYREVAPDGTVSGGPMRYLSAGLSELGMKPFGQVLSVIFALMCIGGSFGGGNMFQANQSYAAIADVIPFFASDNGALIYGIILALLVGAVIIGGIQRIGAAASVIVPFMCGVYVLAGVAVLIANASAVPAAFGAIVSEAFSPMAGLGGAFGVLAVGFQRAAFSNEAGVGSASIAHSAASTDEPVREGLVALLEPFIDTIVVCTMTGLVVVVTGAYQIEGVDGVVMTARAFETVFPWFPKLLSVAVVLFAFSTMISWSYYGERCASWLFGDWVRMPYRALFCLFVVFGAVFKLGNVLDFSDLMILGMAVPNILGALFLSTKVRSALDRYWNQLDAGEFDPDRSAA